MKEKFTLACRIIGLVLFCYSLIIILNTLIAMITAHDLLTNEVTRTLLTDETIKVRLIQLNPEIYNQMIDFTPNWTLMIINLAIQGIFPLALGLYLMTSARFFINLCYPSVTISPSLADQPQANPTH